MILTAKQGKGNKMYLSVDGEYALTVGEMFWAKQSFRSGDILSEGEFDELRRNAEAHAAHERALGLLAGRAHSRKELEDKLARKTDRETAADTARCMEQLGLIDDEAYAAALARDLAQRKKWAASRIRMELLARGISRETAQEAVDALELDEAAQLSELLAEKYARQLADEKGRARAAAALQRFGYSYGAIRGALSAWADPEEMSED